MPVVSDFWGGVFKSTVMNLYELPLSAVSISNDSTCSDDHSMHCASIKFGQWVEIIKLKG